MAIKANPSRIAHILTSAPGPGYLDRGGELERKPGKPKATGCFFNRNPTATPKPREPNKRASGCC